jgi:hypothetical protein
MSFIPVEYREQWEQSVLQHAMTFRCTLKALNGDFQLGLTDVLTARELPNLRLRHFRARVARHTIFARLDQMTE